jgi:hypothetical protein
MLLRRITKHVTDQNWFAVFLDFLIVVVGVFIGIQVANWNASLADQQHENEYLERMTADFIAIENRLVNNLAEYDESVDFIVLLRSYIKQKKELNDDDHKLILQGLRRIDSTRVPAWQSATYIEMQSAGDLGLISNKSLKAVLVAYDQGSEIAHKGWALAAHSQTMTVTPQVTGFYEFSPEVSIDQQSANDSFIVSDFDYSRMLEDKTFLAGLSSLIRFQVVNRSLQANQLRLAKKVLDQLRNRNSP